MTKHYIRKDSEKNIIHGFSDKFEQPISGDICINENASRHFPMQELFPKGIITDEGYYKYKYVNKKITEKTHEEIYTLNKAKQAKIELIKADRIEAERIYNIAKQLIDGGDADTIEADLISQVDAATKESDLENIKWG